MSRNIRNRLRNFERLEDRQLMAADISLNNGVLTVQGTNGSDFISFYQSTSDADKIVAQVVDNSNGTILAREEFDRDEVSQLVANGLDGADEIRNYTNIRAKFFGGNGNDSLNSGAGNDLLDGGANDDTLSGNGGIDDLKGGTGNDTYYFGGPQPGSVVVYEDASLDTDTLYFSGMTGAINLNLASTVTQAVGGNLTLRFSSDTGIENVSATAYNDTIHGNARNNVIDGWLGNDSLFGEGGNDDLHGSRGNDSLYGGIGNDHLFGEDDNDYLYGEAGLDTLDGGAANDFLDGGRDGYVDVLKGGTGADTFVKYKKRSIPFIDYEQKVTDYNAVDTVLTVWY